ncbi:MAG: ParB/RepB/Spo0J family partition protein [Firmicutes bacterium]|nr:ParB/RepB/Spo0J family partition protein [Bacillota bacterium]
MDNRKVVELPLDDVLPNRFQPRIKFNEESINELSESIKEHGVIQPIVVRPVGDRYEIIAGERRYKATTLAGLKTIPAIITDLNDKDSAEVALIENVQRQDLTPIEEAISYKKILDMGYLTQENLAEKLGKNQSTVANKLRLLNLDEEVQEALLNEKISERHARSLLKLSNYDDQVKLLNKIIEERLTVRKTDEEISKMLDKREEPTVNNVEILDVEEPIIIPEEDTVVSVENYGIPSTPIMDEPVMSVENYGIPSIPIMDESTNQPETTLDNYSFPSFDTPLSDSEEQEGGEQLIPGRFFNLMEEVEPTTDEIKDEVTEKEENNNLNLDFNSIFNSIPSTPIVDEDITMSPNFGIPNFDDIELPTEAPVAENVSEPVGNNTFVAGDMKTVVNTIRNCTDTIEKYGFTVDTEEFDLEDMYQVIIKINKK